MLQGGSILRSLTKQEKVFGLLSNSGLMPCFQVTFVTPVKQAISFPKCLQRRMKVWVIYIYYIYIYNIYIYIYISIYI